MKRISFRPGRTVALAAIAAFTIGLANCADRETDKETVSQTGALVEKTIVGEKSGLKYVVSVPEKGDPTIDSDLKELIAETEGMLAGLAKRTDTKIAKLPPITITFIGKGKTLTGAPEQPEGKLDERFNDDTDGNPKVARRDAQVVSFTAIKPATRNSFDLGLPARLRTLTLRDAEARKVTAGVVGKAGGRVSEKIEPNKPGKLVPQGWSLNDDNPAAFGCRQPARHGMAVADHRPVQLWRRQQRLFRQPDRTQARGHRGALHHRRRDGRLFRLHGFVRAWRHPVHRSVADAWLSEFGHAELPQRRCDLLVLRAVAMACGEHVEPRAVRFRRHRHPEPAGRYRRLDGVLVRPDQFAEHGQ